MENQHQEDNKPEGKTLPGVGEGVGRQVCCHWVYAALGEQCVGLMKPSLNVLGAQDPLPAVHSEKSSHESQGSHTRMSIKVLPMVTQRSDTREVTS